MYSGENPNGIYTRPRQHSFFSPDRGNRQLVICQIFCCQFFLRFTNITSLSVKFDEYEECSHQKRMLWVTRRGTFRQLSRSRVCCWRWAKGVKSNPSREMVASPLNLIKQLKLDIFHDLHHRDELTALVSDVGIEASNKRYSSFMPSLEDQGQFWIIAEPEYMIEISGMMIGMGKRSSWGRPNLPWAKRWLTTGGLFVKKLLT